MDGDSLTEWNGPTDLRAEDVDEGIWPILERINESGWARSTYSCAGHWEEDGVEWTSHPYVQVRVHSRDLGRLVACLQAAVEECASIDEPVDAHFVLHPDTRRSWRAALHYVGPDSRPITEEHAARGRMLLFRFAQHL